MLRCMDNSIYTGITTDLERRMQEHFSQDKKCAKYTHSHPPKKLESVWKTEDKKYASKLEYHIKTLSKGKKEKLSREKDIAEVLADKVDVEKYILKGE